MLCVSDTRNVVNNPKRTCCERPVLTAIVKPMTNVAMKQMIEINADVSSARTIFGVGAGPTLKRILPQAPQNVVVEKQICYYS